MAKKIKTTKSNFSEKFTDEDEYLFQEEITREFIESDLGMYIILYQVDRTKSNPGDIYNEATKDNTIYLNPIQLNVIYHIAESANTPYNTDNATGQYKQIGNLTFPIFESQLQESNCDIEVGDVIGVPITSSEFEFFEVSDDGRANIDNAHSVFGYRKKVRNIVAVMTDPNKIEIYDGK